MTQQAIPESDTPTESAVAIYFSSPECGVCQVLQPQIRQLIATEFPRIEWTSIDCIANPALAAEYSVFSVPALIIRFDGQEVLRMARHFSPAQVRDQLVRPYTMFFDE